MNTNFYIIKCPKCGEARLTVMEVFEGQGLDRIGYRVECECGRKQNKSWQRSPDNAIVIWNKEIKKVE